MSEAPEVNKLETSKLEEKIKELENENKQLKQRRKCDSPLTTAEILQQTVLMSLSAFGLMSIYEYITKK